MLLGSRVKGQGSSHPNTSECDKEMLHPIKTTTTDEVKMMVAKEMVTKEEEGMRGSELHCG